VTRVVLNARVDPSCTSMMGTIHAARPLVARRFVADACTDAATCPRPCESNPDCGRGGLLREAAGALTLGRVAEHATGDIAKARNDGKRVPARVPWNSSRIARETASAGPPSPPTKRR
jgi:hypothetical protein